MSDGICLTAVGQSVRSTVRQSVRRIFCSFFSPHLTHQWCSFWNQSTPATFRLTMISTGSILNTVASDGINTKSNPVATKIQL
jgi:hypothetical protein